MTPWEATRDLMTGAMGAIFAEPVTYAQTGHADTAIDAIILADLSFTVRQGGTVTRQNGDAYEVTKVEPDGEGGAKLYTVKR